MAAANVVSRILGTKYSKSEHCGGFTRTSGFEAKASDQKGEVIVRHVNGSGWRHLTSDKKIERQLERLTAYAKLLGDRFNIELDRPGLRLIVTDKTDRLAYYPESAQGITQVTPTEKGEK